MKNFVFSSMRFAGTVFNITSRFMSSRNAFMSISGECWLDTTTVSTRTGLSSSYSTVTCVLPSGRR